MKKARLLESRSLSFFCVVFVVLLFSLSHDELIDISKLENSYSRNDDNTRVRLWRTGADIDFPESEFLNKLGKTSSGLAVSGGGLRSYMSTIGYYEALSSLNSSSGKSLLSQTRYTSSVSGGSWASIAYTFHQSSENDFLDTYTPPDLLDLYNLRQIPDLCAKKLPARLDVVLEAMIEIFLQKLDPSYVWYTTIQTVFFEPVGIPSGAFFVYDFDLFQDSLKRNPWLSQSDRLFLLPGNCKFQFLTPKKVNFFDSGLGQVLSLKEVESRWMSCVRRRPFPIVNAAILGPKESAPFSLFHMKYAQMEFTPSYIGSNNPVHIDFPCDEDEIALEFGGFVESIGFGADFSTVTGLSETEKTKAVDVPSVDSYFTMTNASGASSWAPGSLLSENSLINKYLNRYIGLETKYWSPQTVPSVEQQKILLADSGSLDNQGLLSLIQRKVKKIVCFINTDRPLSDFDPYKTIPNRFDIDASFLSYFGFPDWIPIPGFDLRHNQVFSRLDYLWLAADMVRKKAEGTGVVVPSVLTTVKNEWFGIEAGFQVEVLWVYLDKPEKWYGSLSGDVQKFISKEYPKFPFIPTDVLNYSPELSNLLANLGSWVVRENKELFEEYLG